MGDLNLAVIPLRLIRSSSVFRSEQRPQSVSHGVVRGILTFATLMSVVVFPWPLTAVLALAGASVEPLLPLAAGLFADTLYFAPRTLSLPLFTFCGAAATILAFFVRNRLWAGSIR